MLRELMAQRCLGSNQTIEDSGQPFHDMAPQHRAPNSSAITKIVIIIFILPWSNVHDREVFV